MTTRYLYRPGRRGHIYIGHNNIAHDGVVENLASYWGRPTSTSIALAEADDWLGMVAATTGYFIQRVWLYEP